ncbi:MAG TPA: nuclear transport factor 2 family protein [Pyrinomonadaceae bacterium]
MSESNKKIVEKVNAAFTEGNTEGFLSYCADDVVWKMEGEKTTNGIAEIREWMKQMDGMEPPKFTVDKTIAEGESVVCYGEMSMKGEDGKEGNYSYCDAYTFAGDKIKELRSFVVKHKSEEKSSPASA